MIITVELPSDVETQIYESVSRQDAATVRRLLTAALAQTVDTAVEQLLRGPRHASIHRANQLTDAEFEELVDELLDMTPVVSSLSDYAVSREGIYEDHP